MDVIRNENNQPFVDPTIDADNRYREPVGWDNNSNLWIVNNVKYPSFHIMTVDGRGSKPNG
jgi:hypothetical protein